eukprot:TRINITY_DN18588_c0_g2_i1.p1 TRINITY_DN18588_c0_g2~~TRINITY_DN18588_c0_g2_i1.p1  ORF type:complete len:523 (+),score=212.51 TRINITY_DN18588_c0_g2_i1:98-1666(+)
MEPMTMYLAAALFVCWLVWARRWIPNPPKGVPVPKEGVLNFMYSMYKHVARDKDIPLHELLLRVARENNWKPFGWARAGPHGWDSVYVVTHPKEVKHMLKDNFWNYEKHDGQVEKMREFLGVTPSIFGTNGDLWKEQRQVLSTMFSVRSLRDKMSLIFGEHAQEVNQALARRVRDEPHAAIDMHSMWYCYTFDTSNRIAFKRPVNSVGGVARDLEFQRAFDSVQDLSIERYLFPLWKVNRVLGLGNEGVIKHDLQVLNEYIDSVIDEYFDTDGSEGISPSVRGDGTVLALFIVHGRQEGKSYSRTYLRDLVLTFLLGGRDTTGSTLTTLTYLLCKDEAGLQWQEKLYAEACHVFGENADESLTYSDVDNVPVCEGLLNETWRCFPPVPTEEKVCLREDTMPQSGHKIPKGALVYYVPYLLNRNPEVWGPDADIFKPERWWTEGSDGQLKMKTMDEYEMTTFNAGPRLCLGKYMAILEAKVAMLTFARKWKWTLKDGYHPQLKSPCVMIQPLNGMYIHLEPRD